MTTVVIDNKRGDEAQEPTLTLNFGPQHPAAHGVLRLILDLDGEIVTRVVHISGSCIAAPRN